MLNLLYTIMVGNFHKEMIFRYRHKTNRSKMARMIVGLFFVMPVVYYFVPLLSLVEMTMIYYLFGDLEILSDISLKATILSSIIVMYRYFAYMKYGIITDIEKEELKKEFLLDAYISHE